MFSKSSLLRQGHLREKSASKQSKVSGISKPTVWGTCGLHAWIPLLSVNFPSFQNLWFLSFPLIQHSPRDSRRFREGHPLANHRLRNARNWSIGLFKVPFANWSA